MTWEITHSVVAKANRQTAWDFYANVDNWVRFEGGAVESITLDGPFQAGTKGATKMPGQAPTHWRLIEVEPPGRVVIQMELTDAVVRVVWTFDELPGDCTRLTQHMALEGPGAEAYVAVMEENFARNIGKGMERMAEEIARYSVGQ